MSDSSKAPQAHLALVQHSETGLYHGAVYRNHPTPSGCDRFILAFTTDEGFGSKRKAAEAINAGFPDLPSLDLTPLAKEDENVEALVFPPGTWITAITPQRDNKREPNVPEVEVKTNGKVIQTLSLAQLRMMIARKMVVHDSGSGCDQNLYYRYEHYYVA